MFEGKIIKKKSKTKGIAKKKQEGSIYIGKNIEG
jgi:hypothetical protein